MKIAILAAGSRGDTQPYIALGAALKKAGCEVRLASFKNFESLITSYGLEFAPLHGDIQAVTATATGQEGMQADNPLKVLLSFNKLKALAMEIPKDFYKACQGVDAVVYHPGATIGYFAAQQMKIPSVLASPFPMMPTRDYPSLIFYDKVRMGNKYNLLTHKIFERIMWMGGSGVKNYWKKEFGCLPENFACPYPEQTTRRLPTIISCSDFVFPRPADWPEHVTNTGYWFLEDEGDWTPPQDLKKFLKDGTPPIYVGFGSVGDPTTAVQTTRMVIDALKCSGQRGILATGWNAMSMVDDLPEDIFILESAPHTWLFPRMAAVVHHGGAGTTAAGLQAGIPSIVIPHSNDQFAWARRVCELGVGAKPIPRKKLTAETLCNAIKNALTPEIIERANILGANIRTENGAETGARIIIDTLNQ